MGPSQIGALGAKKTTPDSSDWIERAKESSAAVWTFGLLTAAAAGMACLIALLPAAGHDQMWCLYAARLVLHGARLYGPEVFESNPPLILWMSLLPAWIAGWTHVPATAVGKALVLGVETGVSVVSLKLWRGMQAGQSEKLGSSKVVALAFCFVAIFAVMPARDFGQRDHLLVLLCLPYVIAAALDARGRAIPRWAGIGIGLAAGIGLALKPHQALIPVAVESTIIFLRWQRGRKFNLLRRPEPFLILGCGFAYLLAIHLFAANYFTQVVPILRDTYWAFGHLTWLQLVAESLQLHILILVTAVFAAGWRRTPPVITLLIAAGAASTAAFYVQGTGWYYQQLPALSFFALALCLLAGELAEARRLKVPRWAPGTAAGLSLLALGLTAHFAGYPFTEARSFPIDVPDPSFFAGLPPGTPVATLTTTVDYTVPPAFRYGLTIAQRYPHLWMLPAILRSENAQGAALARQLAAARVAQLDAIQHAAMREDFARWGPRLVLVERCQDPAVHCQVLEGRHDDLLAWFLRDPGFRAEFAGYRYLRSSREFDAYVPK